MANSSDDERTTEVLTPEQRRAARRGAEAQSKRAKLTCLDPTYLPDPQTGFEIPLDARQRTIGRSRENSIQLDAASVSRRHARISFERGQWFIEDLGSRNGVWVNKTKVERTVLKPGDRIDIGKVPFHYELVDLDEAPAETSGGPRDEEMLLAKKDSTSQERAERSMADTVVLGSQRKRRRYGVLIGIAVVVAIAAAIAFT